MQDRATSAAPDQASLAARLAARTAVAGLFVKPPAPAQVEAARHAGLDFVVLDGEHGAASGVELEHHLRAADAVGLPALVRVPAPDRPEAVQHALDGGAAGVVVPHVRDAAAARAAVAAARYPPLGARGIATTTRAGGHGAVGVGAHLARSAAETVVVVQIEDAEAVGRAAEILAVEGVGAVLIGVADLALSLGAPGEPAAAPVVAAVDAILAAAAAADVPVMVVASDAADAARWRARGATAVAFVGASLLLGAQRAVAPAAHVGQGHQLGAAELVFLPGMGCDGDLWGDVAAALGSERRAVRPGRVDLAEDVATAADALLAAVDAPRLLLAGHSFGAIVALEAQRRAPERVAGLVLADASARGASEAQRAAWDALGRELDERPLAAVARDLAAANLDGSAAAADDPALAARAAAQTVRLGADALRRQLAAQRTRPESRDRLGAVGVPTLVITGARDVVCPPALQQELAAGLPHARHVVLDDAAHLAPLERPAAVAAAIDAFINDQEQR
jgi:4-hydroxy-2-oxoheptanedioate aldolase